VTAQNTKNAQSIRGFCPGGGCNNYITKKALEAIGSADAVGYVFTT
jgi:hypothetical protein